MGTGLKYLSDYKPGEVPRADDMIFGIVVSEWNSDITGNLLKGTFETLTAMGAKKENIHVKSVPGSFELTLGAQLMAENADLDAIICLGCVIRGETPHFDYICRGVTYGITDLNMNYNMPFVFGVLTTDSMEQAIDRSGGRYGNKGEEAAVTAVKMIALQRELEQEDAGQ
ncbi:MAG: 6,7-dimethyl-8-ribityllumazine synthase [Bacteroidales bacterium]